MKNNNFYYNKITKQSIEYYNKYGFIVIKKFFKEKKIVSIRKEILKKSKKNKNNFFYYEKIKKNNFLRRIEKVTDFSIQAKKILLSKKIFNFLELLEKKKFVLFKDKLNFKYPGSKGFLPHIDGHFFWKDRKNKYQNGWYKYSNNFINLVVPLEKSDLQNGCIYLSKKSDTQKLGKNFKSITKKLLINTPNLKKGDVNNFKFYPIILKKGDLCIFNWKCAHFSKKNNSNKSRMILYSTYSQKNSTKDVRKSYYFDKLKSKSNSKNKSLLFN